MKKVYLGLLASLFVVPAMAQIQGDKSKMSSFSYEKAPKNVIFNEKAALWEDDFSDAANWELSNTSSPALNWSFSTNVNGSPVAALNPIGFSTVSNGYVMINSDAAGDNATQNARIETANPIDLTGNPYVTLKFQHIYRTFEDRRVVHVSGDNGATWTDYVITEGLNSEANVNTANPAEFVMNISDVAGNKSQVLVAFSYEAAYGWFWAIDDVQIVVTDTYDVMSLGSYWGVEGEWGIPLPYGITPVAQIQPIKVGAIVQNVGATDLTGVVVDATSTSYTATATSPVAIGVKDTIFVSPDFTPTATAGTYNVAFAVSTGATQVEDNTVNNAIASFPVVVSNNIYARDLNTTGGGLFRQGEPFEIGNIYDIFANQTLTAIDVHIAAGAVAGANIYGRIYTISEEGEFVYGQETNPRELAASDLGQIITLPMAEAYNVAAGTSYLVVIGTYGAGGANDDLVVVSSGSSEAQTTFLFDVGEDTWYYSTSTPKVRMNFDASVAVKNVASLEGVNVYPNPSTGLVNISNDLAVENNIVVTDITGKVVASKVASVATTVDLSTFGTGIYMVEVSNTNGKKVERVIIK